MITRNRGRSDRRWSLRQIAVTVVVLAVGLTACGDDSAGSAGTTTILPTTTTKPAERPTELVDEIVRIDSGRMHLRCIGEGATTVLLLAGWGDGGDSWGAIEPAIADRARVCSYARFGTGTSDPPATTQTFATQVADLQALLDEAGEPGPYVVVGHSFGGTEGVAFASQRPDDVVGLMLLDATPPTWPAAICAVPDDGTNDARDLAALCASYDPAQHPERLDVFTAFEEVATIRSLDDLPMIVMSAAQRSLDDLGAGEVSRLNAAWADGLDRWAALSTSSTTVVVEDTGHYIQVDKPDVVIEQLLSLLATTGS